MMVERNEKRNRANESLAGSNEFAAGFDMKRTHTEMQPETDRKFEIKKLFVAVVCTLRNLFAKVFGINTGGLANSCTCDEIKSSGKEIQLSKISYDRHKLILFSQRLI